MWKLVILDSAERVRFHWLETSYLLGLLPLHVATAWLLPFALPNLMFLPLMLISVYSAVGVSYAWVLCHLNFAMLTSGPLSSTTAALFNSSARQSSEYLKKKCT